MINLVLASLDQLPLFVEMEQGEDTAVNGTPATIAPYTLAKHQTIFDEAHINYVAIMREQQLVGFMLTALDPDGQSVELRRIVVAPKGEGIGQRALTLLEQQTQTVWRRRRIWLDVFADNERGLHIYTKLGYTFFKDGLFAGRPLLFYEKWL